jgi:hypothetical protein
MCWRIGLFDGLNRPGLDEGVLAAVLDAVAGSIVEMQQGESRHVWGTSAWEEVRGVSKPQTFQRSREWSYCSARMSSMSQCSMLWGGEMEGEVEVEVEVGRFEEAS